MMVLILKIGGEHQMANIVSVREFVKNFRYGKPGTQLIVVDAARRKVLACLTVEEKPATVERNIKQIFTS